MRIRQPLIADSPRRANASPPETLITAAVLATLAAPAPAQQQFHELLIPQLPNGAANTVALGDVDGDGDLDLVKANYGGQNRLYLNDGTGTFTDATAERMPVDSDNTRAVALGDVDGDGDLDMVFGNGHDLSPKQSWLYLNDGTGSFTDATAQLLPAASYRTYALALGDVDSDGDLDIVLGNSGHYGGQQNRLYLNDGAGTFTDVTAARMPVDIDNTRAVALGDVDGDGDLDMVLANGNIFHGRANLLYLNDGTGTYTNASQFLSGDLENTIAVALGDVDGDGDLDVYFVNSHRCPGIRCEGGPNQLYLNDGSGTYSDATAGRVPVSYGGTIALGDVDEDGDLDMILPSGLYLNDGSGTYVDATQARMPDRRAGGLLGDVDGDGDLDIVSSKLYLNLLRQLDTPSALVPGGEFRLDAYARYGPPRAGDIALAFISDARASVPVPPLGTIGIDLSRSAALPPFFIPQPSGMNSVSIPVPDDPRLIGVSIYAQALLVPFGGPWHLTNATADVIIR